MVGDVLGIFDGCIDGGTVGLEDGVFVGDLDGLFEGDVVGIFDGKWLGFLVGGEVGFGVGCNDGFVGKGVGFVVSDVGLGVGSGVGSDVGGTVGCGVGLGVGSEFCSHYILCCSYEISEDECGLYLVLVALNVWGSLLLAGQEMEILSGLYCHHLFYRVIFVF